MTNPAIDHPALEPIIRDAAGDLFAQRSPAAQQAIVARAVWHAYTTGRGDAIRDLHTTDQAAAELGITSGRVRQLARSRNVGWEIGRDWLFRPEDIDAMRERRPGRPAKARS